MLRGCIMPITKSFKKSVKTSEKSHLRNMSVRSKVKKSIKNFETILDAKNGKESVKSFLETVSVLDKAASKGVFSKNTVARSKSRLARKLNDMGFSIPKKQKEEKEVPVKAEKKAASKVKEEVKEEVKEA